MTDKHTQALANQSNTITGPDEAARNTGCWLHAVPYSGTPPVSPARGPPTDWVELVRVHDDRSVFQASPDELPDIDIHSL